MRLLLVEDSDGYAALLATLLSAEPVQLVRCAGIAEALPQLPGADCVLLDLGLPDADGPDGLHRILRARPEVPVVVLTGNDDPALPARLLAAGAQDFVLKGEEAQLMRAVRHAVSRRPAPREERRPLLPGRRARRLEDRVRLLEAIVEGTSDAVYVKDLEGRYVLLNDAAAAVFGGPREAILGRTAFEVVDEGNAAAWRDGDAEVLAAGEPRRHWRTSTVAGEERTLSTVKLPYRDRDGAVAGVIGISRDETDKRRLEEETGRFFDLAPDMLCTVGPDGALERVNAAWSAALGWSAEELRARRLLEFVHPHDRAEFRLLLAGTADGCANRLATRAGGWRDVEWTARTDRGRLYAVVRDVTERNAMAEALAAGEERYRTLVHNLPNTAVVTFDHDLRFTFAAGEALAAAGLDGHVVGRTLAEVLPEAAAELTPRYRAALGGHAQSFQFRGGDREYWVQISPLREGDGGMVLSQDVTAFRAAERGQSRAEELFRTAFEQAPIGMGLVSLEGRYLQVNGALCAITGYAPEQLLQTSVVAVTHPDDAAADAAGRDDLIAGRIEVHRTEKRYLHASGHPVWVAVHATLVRDADGEPSHILGQIVDITERRRFEERLQHLVDHDALTGLFTRRRFEQELERHVAHAARYGAAGALLVLDLDDFKLVNDTLGHNAGDELIVAVGALLKAQLRETDLVARLGGDEFAVLLPTGGREEAEAVAAKLVSAVRDEVTVAGARRSRRVTVSAGVALFCGGDITGEEMLVDADLAMYDAKEAGRDRYAVYDRGDHEQARTENRMRWVERIRDALEDDRLVLHAQPILDLRTGAVGQHELLVRMLDEHGDLIPPGAFLQVAERFDLVQQIDRWVARRALELIAEHGVRLTVNLSGRTLGDPELLAALERDIARTGADPAHLTFEVTETAAVANIHQAREFAERLREIGCRFALDDFGAGFGSFYYLKHLPFDYLKIDGEFVAGCLADRTDQLVIRAVVDIAQGLGKETVAEFAADAELVAFLRSQGVDHAQGFHIGRPVPLAEALATA